MTSQRLTDISIRALPLPPKGQKTYFEREGFGVRVSQGGTKTFVQMQGKERKLHTIGRVGQISLKDARKAAKAIQVAPPAKIAANGLVEARSAFLASAEKRCRPATVANYKLYLDRLTHDRLDQIQKADLTYSNHALMAGKVFLNWCVREGLIDRNIFQHDKVTYNHRSRFLSDDEIKRVWAYEATPFSDHVKLLLLTGQRRSQFSNFEIRGDTLFFPAEVMKGKNDHTIPLLPLARHYAEKLQPWNGWSKAKARLDKKVPMSQWVLHDLRRTFSTTMASLRIPLEVTEKILDHKSGSISGVAAIYNKHSYLEEAREALQKYEEHIKSIVA